MVETNAPEVFQIVSSVEIGIRLGHDIMTQVGWKVPSDRDLSESILNHIRGEPTTRNAAVDEQRVRRALQLTTPRDKRTLIELVLHDMANTKPAKLLLNRVKTLLQREIRRELLNETIRDLSMGDYVNNEPEADEWYWLEEETGYDKKTSVHIYCGKVEGGRRNKGRLLHVDSGTERAFSLDKAKLRTYTPVAEAITRAQKAFMTIELDHGKKIKYSAFMELSFLRIALGRLAVVAEMACESLDNARLNVLREIQRSSSRTQIPPGELVPGNTYYLQDPNTKQFRPFLCNKQYGPTDLGWNTLVSNRIVSVQPQNVVVVGGGPTGLLSTIHCAENCLASGGVMKLYEARDAFQSSGSTFERAQIVRLDSRWISMLRYHLGTAFEDVFIALAGETDAQLGNTLPTQGFVEITIKDLECMLHVEVSRLWSRGVITVYTDSKAQYDLATNSLTKFGTSLKDDDV